jgi:hypothetical protein
MARPRKPKSLVLMNQDIRGVLIALIIIIVIFAAGMGGYYLR